MGLLFYLILIWLAVYAYHEVLLPRQARRRRRLKVLAAHVKERLAWDRDILAPADCQRLEGLCEQADTLKAEADAGKLGVFFSRAHGELARIYPKDWTSHGKDILELLVVVFGVVMGIRGLFLQPFKIPTGSMQPSLYGIHFEPTDKPGVPGPVGRVLRYVNFAARPIDEVVKEDGLISGRVREGYRINASRFLPYTVRYIGEQEYQLPGREGKVDKYLSAEFKRHQDEGEWPYYAAGDVLARGALVHGDHLFVDRVTYNFAEPRRGDIVVFVTDGITHNGGSLNGRYYIKRMVGLPGEELKIENGRLYVRPGDVGESEAENAWRLIDGSERACFERMYSLKGGYRGYYLPPPLSFAGALNEAKPTVRLGPDEYFMLGDNSENSLDSRYWGPVPRGNIVGRACFVWWPFSRRWGLADRGEPLTHPSPPTKGNMANAASLPK